MHISEIFWEKLANANELPRVGREIDVCISDVDIKNMKVSLSLKRLQPNPFISKYEIGSNIKVQVTSITDNGVFVKVDEQINGFIHISELSDARIEHPNKIVKIGDIIEVRVMNYNEEHQNLTLSLKQALDDDLYLGQFRVKHQ